MQNIGIKIFETAIKIISFPTLELSPLTLAASLIKILESCFIVIFHLDNCNLYLPVSSPGMEGGEEGGRGRRG